MPDIQEARLSTEGGLKYALVEGYPRGGITLNGPTSAQEVYRIAATDLEDFLAEIMPPMEIIDDRVVIPPLRPLPGAPLLMPSKVSFEPFNLSLPCDPFGNDTNAPDGTYCDDIRLTIDYETGINSNEEQDRDDADPETFLERNIRSSMEILSIPSSGTVVARGDITNPNEQGSDAWYEFEKANAQTVKTPQPDIRMMVCINEFNFRWKRVLRPHWQNIFGTMGTVNAAAYPWLLNAPAGTVLFLGVSGSQEFQNAGSRVVVKPWSLELRFAHKQINANGSIYSWNHVYDPSPGVGKFVTVFRRGTSGGTGAVMHNPSNFNALFAAGPVL